MRKLYRSRTDVKLAGVVAGLADYIKMDPNLLRIIVVLGFFFTGIVPVLVTYFIGWAIIPETPLPLNMPAQSASDTSEPQKA